MKNSPGTLQEGGAPFPTTHWRVVVQAMESQPPASVQQALGDFCQAYWPPLYTFVRRRAYAPADVKAAGKLTRRLSGSMLLRSPSWSNPAR